ncbi:MAG TPA: BPSL0067 family protein [Blastocatellia bacterium]
MAYIANDPEQYIGTSFGSGQCVAFVQECAGAPITHDWKEGEKVRGADIPRGTAIATFQDGEYQNDLNGNSHAAIYLEQDDEAIYVLDQWISRKPQPVHMRRIKFKGGADEPRNDGDAYSVIE